MCGETSSECDEMYEYNETKATAERHRICGLHSQPDWQLGNLLLKAEFAMPRFGVLQVSLPQTRQAAAKEGGLGEPVHCRSVYPRLVRRLRHSDGRHRSTHEPESPVTRPSPTQPPLHTHKSNRVKLLQLRQPTAAHLRMFTAPPIANPSHVRPAMLRRQHVDADGWDAAGSGLTGSRQMLLGSGDGCFPTQWRRTVSVGASRSARSVPPSSGSQRWSGRPCSSIQRRTMQQLPKATCRLDSLRQIREKLR